MLKELFQIIVTFTLLLDSCHWGIVTVLVIFGIVRTLRIEIAIQIGIKATLDNSENVPF